MKRWILALGLIGASQVGAQARIEVRKVRTLLDRDGRGFSKPPSSFVPVSGGRYAGAVGEDPAIVVDSTGQLVKTLGRRGSGPGEFPNGTGAMHLGKGDTLYVGNSGAINVYAPDLSLARTIRTTRSFSLFQPVGNGFAVAGLAEGRGEYMAVHLLAADGHVVRSFGPDTFVQSTPGVFYHERYRIAGAGDGTIWLARNPSYVLERWTIDGKRTLTV